MKSLKVTVLILSAMLFIVPIAGCQSQPQLQNTEPSSASEPPSIPVSEPIKEAEPEPESEPNNDWVFDAPS